MARWACVLYLSLTVALVLPVARPPSHVVCGGAALDYCVQSLGCTAEEARKIEAMAAIRIDIYMPASVLPPGTEPGGRVTLETQMMRVIVAPYWNRNRAIRLSSGF